VKPWNLFRVAGLLALTTLPAGAQDMGAVSNQLVTALSELDAVRRDIGGESIALNQRLNELQRRRAEAREAFDQTRRTLDRRSLDLNNLNQQTVSLEKSKDYLATLFDEYLRNWESRLHVVEVPLYQDTLSEARNALDNNNLGPADKFRLQIGAVEASVGRLESLVGGTRFQGTAVGSDGRVKAGTFFFLGPLAYFSSVDGSLVGEAEQFPNQNEPGILDFGTPDWLPMTRALVEKGEGEFPFDPSQGNARKMAATQETFLEHLIAGGVVMYPILIMFAIALLIIAYKWLAFTFSPTPGQAELDALYAALRQGKQEEARTLAGKMPGNLGAMLKAGCGHLEDPKDLIEEVMFEKLLDTRFKVNRLLPFISVCAASAPLLGLLGTVTGIINTFKLLTVFGSGDVKALSSGISEALITTEYGLIVAIPSLLAHAFLTRSAKAKIDRMEQSAILFMSGLEMFRARAERAAAHGPVADDGCGVLAI
jgi:biopolymer transport protein ExbB